MSQPSIYDYIKEQENSFQTDQIQVGDNWFWNFRDHVQLIFHLMNGQFYTGENDWMRAFKVIMKPLRNLAKWSEDIEVKDVVFFIENETGRVLSFLLKKFHDEVFVKKHNLDTVFDDITLSDLDYGGTLVQPTADGSAEVIQPNSVAFCDQTDIKGGPIGFKFNFSPDKLRKMAAKGWGDAKNGATISIDGLCVLAEPHEKEFDKNNNKNTIPGKNIELYIVKGSLPEHYLKDNNDMETYYEQAHVVGFYYNKENKQEGVTLYRKKAEDNIKFFTSEPVYGRALGAGEGESLLHPQIWTNFLTIHKMSMLEAGAKSPLWTDDDNFTGVNVISEQENLTVNKVSPGSHIGLIPTIDANKIQLFSNTVNEWYENGQLNASAQDPILGKEAVSGTTFRGQERSIQQSQGLHKMRQGQRAKFIEELYRDIWIPSMVKEMKGNKKFMATLSSDEMKWVSEQLAINYANRKIIDAELYGNGDIPDVELLKQEFIQIFNKKGNKHLIEILDKEFDDVEIKMGINIAGKQKDLAGLSDKILSIVQFALANPIPPAMQKPVNDILEFSGISPADFTTLVTMKPEVPAGAVPSPIQPAQLNQPTA